MKKSILLLPVILFCGFGAVLAQNPNPNSPYPQPQPASTDAVTNISIELTKISRSVQTLNTSLKTLVDKFGTITGPSLNDKQQKVIMGLDILVRAEQRVAIFQTSQIDLTEKLNETRAKLTQTEIDLRPRNIDRSLAFEGTTETDELREAKRAKLTADRTSLTQLYQQIQGALAENTDNLREAQATANRLRKIYLPEIDRETLDQ